MKDKNVNHNEHNHSDLNQKDMKHRDVCLTEKVKAAG
jgi:hypothetical protein